MRRWLRYLRRLSATGPAEPTPATTATFVSGNRRATTIGRPTGSTPWTAGPTPVVRDKIAQTDRDRHRALTRLRERHEEEYREILAEERAANSTAPPATDEP